MMTGSRILVIDDSTTLRKLVEIAMRGSGCAVEFAASGLEGVSRAKSSRPDVILLDYLLPDLRSADVCKRLRDDTTTSSVPVVVMSANDRGVLEDFRQFTTVVDFVGKPFTATEIRDRLESAIRGGQKPQAAPPPPEAPSLILRSDVASPEAGAGQLVLQGDLSHIPLLEIFRLLAAARASGVLTVEHSDTVRVWLRRGDIVLCSRSALDWTALSTTLGERLTPALRERVTQAQQIGKPVEIVLAEAGITSTSELPQALQSLSAQRVGELLASPSGRFAWQSLASLPDFVEAFGRHVSLTAITLDHGRRAAEPHSSIRLDQVYDRTDGFTQKLAGARLTAEEQRLLGLVNGRTTVNELISRVKLPAARVAAVLARLSAAELIRSDQSSHAFVRTIAIRDDDRDNFIVPLRARLGSRSEPVEVIELAADEPLGAAARRARPNVLVFSSAALTVDVLERELPALIREGEIAVVCVLDIPDAALTTKLRNVGVHEVVSKPLHVNELERLLSPV
jgi:CheY-like chemotaxis protein